MPAPLWTEKTHTFLAPDGSELTCNSTRDYTFAVVTADPSWRILTPCTARSIAEKRASYYHKIWPDYTGEILIVKRTRKEYPFAERSQHATD